MGDVVSLVERAAETIDAAKAQKIADKMRRGKFDLEDLSDQLAQVERMGGMGGLMGMLPGVAKMKNADRSDAGHGRRHGQAPARHHLVDDEEASAPTPTSSRRRARSASRPGSGTKVEEINKLLKMHRQMADVMKMMGGGKAKGIGAALGNMMGDG